MNYILIWYNLKILVLFYFRELTPTPSRENPLSPFTGNIWTFTEYSMK